LVLPEKRLEAAPMGEIATADATLLQQNLPSAQMPLATDSAPTQNENGDYDAHGDMQMGFTRLVSNWPPPFGGYGKHIIDAEGVPGNVRHEALVARSIVGKLIGSGGGQQKELIARTGCGIFIIGKEPPPNFPADQRLAVFVGTEGQVSHAVREVDAFLQSEGGPILNNGLGGSADSEAVALSVSTSPQPDALHLSGFGTSGMTPTVDLLHEQLGMVHTPGSGLVHTSCMCGGGSMASASAGHLPGASGRSAMLAFGVGGGDVIGSGHGFDRQLAMDGLESARQNLNMTSSSIRPMGFPGGLNGVNEFQRLVGNWPPPFGGFGKKIAETASKPGNVRHDMILDRAVLGCLFGSGSNKQKELIARTGCGIYIIEREPPPNCSEEQRLIVFVGSSLAVSTASSEVLLMLQHAALPQLPAAEVRVLPSSRASLAARPADALPGEVPILFNFQRLVSNWPPPYGGFGKQIIEAEGVPGNVRHEVLVHQTAIGKLIGAGGSQQKELMVRTGCGIFIIGKEPPPNYPEDQRLIVFVGSPTQVSHAVHAVATLGMKSDQNRAPKRVLDSIYPSDGADL